MNQFTSQVAMVEVVGTAPTSAMVEIVYRHSWKSNFINIKGIAKDPITIMKLTKEQTAEITTTIAK